MKTSFSDFINHIGDSTVIPFVANHDSSTSLPQETKFFVQPNLDSLNDFSGTSSFMLIAAPGATGKSSLGYEVSIKKNAIYWDLSKANIGDNYFIGTLTKTFGVSSLPSIIQLINTGDITFIIDAFDEAEMSCGWNRIYSFLQEISTFIKSVHSSNFILLSRFETAQYLALILDELIGSSKYYYYGIDFFEKKEAKEFLIGYLTNLDSKYSSYREKIDQIADIIFGKIDSILGKRGNVDKHGNSFYGYAPVLQALAVLISQYPNLQEFENQYSDASNYNTFIETIMHNIITREQKKVISAFHNRLSSKGLQMQGIDVLFDQDEQLYRIIEYVIEKKNHVELYNTPSISSSVQIEYNEILQQFLPQHPFIYSSNEFSAPAFKDYAIAYVLSSEKLESQLFNNLKSLYSNITPLFWQFYLSNRKDRSILGKHIGIMCESAISGKVSGDEVLTSLYDVQNNTQLSTIINIGDTETNEFTNYSVIPDSSEGLVFHFHLKNIFINTENKLSLGWNHNDFLISNSDVNVNSISFSCKKLTIRTDELDKPVFLSSKNQVTQSDDFTIEKIGAGSLITSWPNGKLFPWSDYYQDISFTEDINTDNLLLSLRQILKWFRKDKRDSIARYRDFIDNIAVNKNKLNQKMLAYLIQTQVLWIDGGLYKLSHKTAEKYGINFTSLKNMECNQQLQMFLREFK